MTIWSILYSILLGFILSEIATLVTTLYLHRNSTHQSVEFHPAVVFCFQLILWLTTGIKRREWVAVHLYHHLHTEEVDDPHSPVVSGFWKVQLGNVFLYRKAAQNPKVMQYAKHIQLTRMERGLFRSPAIGLALGIAIACLLFGWKQGLLLSGVHMLFYVFFLNNLVNGLCHVPHLLGYKNFPLAHAFNNHLVAWITGGEGFHNNHHRNPFSPKFSTRMTEIDIGGYIISLLQRLRLAEVKMVSF